jgi:class 3 adenylate cyclase
LKLCADNVQFVTNEPFLKTEDLFRFGSTMVQSRAYLRATRLGTTPQLLAVFDEESAPRNGGTAEIVAGWRDEFPRHIIDLTRLREKVCPTVLGKADQPVETSIRAPVAVPIGISRVIQTMLFADVVGYSKLDEDQVPYFIYRFLTVVAKRLRQLPVQPVLVNTWGDAIFAVMNEAVPLLDYAFALQEVVLSTDWKEHALPDDINVRIGLHSGPVFQGNDEIVNRTGYFGSHVNRTARIEPVTVPGRIYASRLFVGLLTHEQIQGGYTDRSVWPFRCEYLGNLSLAKGYGMLPAYHVRRSAT